MMEVLQCFLTFVDSVDPPVSLETYSAKICHLS